MPISIVVVTGPTYKGRVERLKLDVKEIVELLIIARVHNTTRASDREISMTSFRAGQKEFGNLDVLVRVTTTCNSLVGETDRLLLQTAINDGLMHVYRRKIRVSTTVTLNRVEPDQLPLLIKPVVQNNKLERKYSALLSQLYNRHTVELLRMVNKLVSLPPAR